MSFQLVELMAGTVTGAASEVASLRWDRHVHIIIITNSRYNNDNSDDDFLALLDSHCSQ